MNKPLLTIKVKPTKKGFDLYLKSEYIYQYLLTATAKIAGKYRTFTKGQKTFLSIQKDCLVGDADFYYEHRDIEKEKFILCNYSDPENYDFNVFPLCSSSLDKGVTFHIPAPYSDTVVKAIHNTYYQFLCAMKKEMEDTKRDKAR